MKKVLWGGVFLTIGLMTGAVVQAQVLPNYHGPAASFEGDGYGVPPGAVYVRGAGKTGRYCLKLCPSDTLPCDPAYFKHADARCSFDRF